MDKEGIWRRGEAGLERAVAYVTGHGKKYY